MMSLSPDPASAAKPRAPQPRRVFFLGATGTIGRVTVRALVARHRFLGAGGGEMLQRRLMLGQRMAGDIEAEQFLFVLQQFGIGQLLDLRQRVCCGL